MKLKSLLAATVFAVASGSTAFAATYGFSFSNVDGDIAGTVTGQITLADGDGTFAADSIFVNSAPNTLGYDPLGFDFTSGFTNTNSFTVLGGAITSADFLGVFTPDATGATALALSNSFFDGSTFLTAFQGGISIVNRINDSADSTLTFESVSAVPLPASIPLLFGALGMLGLTARKRKS